MYMKLAAQNTAWRGYVGAVAICLKLCLIYEGYNSLHNHQMWPPTNHILLKRQLLNSAVNTRVYFFEYRVAISMYRPVHKSICSAGQNE